jgi:hypothetical protein
VSEDVAIAQIATAITTIFYAAVFAIGYFLLIRGNKQVLAEMREQRISGGRPRVLIEARYANLPRVDLVARNSGVGAARNITFELSNPLVSSDGFVVSDLAYLRRGMDFLGPGEEVACVWDELDPLLATLREKGLEDGIAVRVRYTDLGNQAYDHQLRINPLLYEETRLIPPADAASPRS